jgi:hypothetical protein
MGMGWNPKLLRTTYYYGNNNFQEIKELSWDSYWGVSARFLVDPVEGMPALRLANNGLVGLTDALLLVTASVMWPSSGARGRPDQVPN